MLLNWFTSGSGIPLVAISRTPTKHRTGVVNQNASVSPASLQSETPKAPESPRAGVSIETPRRLSSPPRRSQPLQNTCENTAWFAIRPLLSKKPPQFCEGFQLAPPLIDSRTASPWREWRTLSIPEGSFALVITEANSRLAWSASESGLLSRSP